MSSIIRQALGAGDSFLATLLDKLLAGAPAAEALERACRVGAFVATQQVGRCRLTVGWQWLAIPDSDGFGREPDSGLFV